MVVMLNTYRQWLRICVQVSRTVQQRRWWLHDFPGTDDAWQHEDRSAVLQQVEFIANRLGCTEASVFHQVLCILLVLHGPQVAQMTDNAIQSVCPHVKRIPGEEAQADGTKDSTYDLQLLHKNIATLWRHRLIL